MGGERVKSLAGGAAIAALLLGGAGATKLVFDRQLAQASGNVVTVLSAHPGYCTRWDPVLEKEDCRPLLVMMGEKECPAGYSPIGGCPNAGTVEVPTRTPTPWGTPPAEPTPEPTEGPAATPSPTPTRPATPTPTSAGGGCAWPTWVIDWRAYSPAPLAVYVTAVAGTGGGDVLVDGQVITLGPREVRALRPRVAPVIGTGVELAGTRVQLIGGVERRDIIPAVRLYGTAPAGAEGS